MSQSLLKPAYRSEPIGSVAALSRALGLCESALRNLGTEASSLYRLAKPIIKPDGSTRQPFDALPRLKSVHARMKVHIFRQIEYPPYLTGSVKGRDYVTNAKLHLNKKIVICEDIQSFFPSVKARLVYDVWVGFFHFPPEVSELLTALTTKDGVLPQGAITSSYLANLVLFRWEPTLYERLASEGISYSRYVDDIALSSATFLPKERQTQLVGAVHGMLSKAGLRAKRKKHEIYTGRGKMITTKLVVNKRVALTGAQRNAVRAAVFQMEHLVSSGPITAEMASQLAKVAARVGHLKRFHKREADGYSQRLATLREKHLLAGFAAPAPLHREEVSPDDSPPPWEL